MRSSIPTISSVSWTDFMTGRNPGKHGVYGFTDIRPGTFTMYFPNFGDVKADTLWDVAGRAGKRSIVMNVPNTYPARALNGLMVSGFVAIKLERAVYPADAAPRGSPPTTTRSTSTTRTPISGRTRSSPTSTARSQARRRVYLKLLRDEPWDLFIGVITECDRLHHYFWDQYADPSAPRHGRFLDFYRRLDEVHRRDGRRRCRAARRCSSSRITATR